MGVLKDERSGENGGDGRPVPGPSGLRWLRYFQRFITDSDINQVFLDLAQEGPGIARFDVPFSGPDFFVLSEPEYVEQVLVDRNRIYTRPTSRFSNLDQLMGQGLLTSSGDLWERQHRLIAPMFHRRSVRGFADLMLREVRAMLRRWEPDARDGEPLDVLKEMKRVTLLVISRALFSAEVEDHLETIRQSLETLRNQLVTDDWRYPFSFPDWMIGRDPEEIQQAQDRLDEIVYGLIEDRRGREEEYDDFLSMLMLAEDEETGERMDDEQVRDEVMTFFVAGHETTANALNWTWWLLSHYPGVRERVYREVRDHSMPDEFDRETYESLTYTNQVLQESLRYYPPVPLMGRQALEDDVLDGYPVPEGSFMITSPIVSHRHPGLWSRPGRFDPERFAPEREEKPRFAYFPFGGGRRICTGRELARMELRIVVSEVARQYRLDHVHPDRDPGQNVAVTLEPERTLRAVPTPVEDEFK